jgi:hypothetical protein
MAFFQKGTYEAAVLKNNGFDFDNIIRTLDEPLTHDEQMAAIPEDTPLTYAIGRNDRGEHAIALFHLDGENQPRFMVSQESVNALIKAPQMFGRAKPEIAMPEGTPERSKLTIYTDMGVELHSQAKLLEQVYVVKMLGHEITEITEDVFLEKTVQDLGQKIPQDQQTRNDLIDEKYSHLSEDRRNNLKSVVDAIYTNHRQSDRGEIRVESPFLKSSPSVEDINGKVFHREPEIDILERRMRDLSSINGIEASEAGLTYTDEYLTTHETKKDLNDTHIKVEDYEVCGTFTLNTQTKMVESFESFRGDFSATFKKDTMSMQVGKFEDGEGIRRDINYNHNQDSYHIKTECRTIAGYFNQIEVLFEEKYLNARGQLHRLDGPAYQSYGTEADIVDGVYPYQSRLYNRIPTYQYARDGEPMDHNEFFRTSVNPELQTLAREEGDRWIDTYQKLTGEKDISINRETESSEQVATRVDEILSQHIDPEIIKKNPIISEHIANEAYYLNRDTSLQTADEIADDVSR